MGLFNIDRNGYLANPQVLFLIVVLAIGVGVIVFAGNILTPLIISLMIARILDGGIGLP